MQVLKARAISISTAGCLPITFSRLGISLVDWAQVRIKSKSTVTVVSVWQRYLYLENWRFQFCSGLGSIGEGSATVFFNPTTLRFLAAGVDNLGPSALWQRFIHNGIDLNGAARTISVAPASGTTPLNSYAEITGVVSALEVAATSSLGGPPLDSLTLPHLLRQHHYHFWHS